jgi:ArsR family transcriptional regulator, arsenate/arsenite/antimonite-responsive transcriptional repressor / arsenate reductase (thioredoxin)
VRELTELVGEPQNLVSYHLGQLRAGGLVSVRRSSADARSAYYSVDLVRCGRLLADAGGALHPGLRLEPPAPGTGRRPPRARRVRVLFLCTGNSARSPIAAALIDHLSEGAVVASSAGSRPKPRHPNTARVLREHGVAPGDQRPRHLDELAGRRFDHVISLCDRVREVCPEFPGSPERVHWSIPDPTADGGNDDQTYPAFQRTATELATRIGFLLQLIETTSRNNPEVH